MTYVEMIRTVLPSSAERRVNDARLRARMLTSNMRMLPDFMIIGAQRCGTGSLFKYLAQHPNILRPLHKEVQFFSRRFGRGLPWYRAHFPLRVRADIKRVSGTGCRTFEATPNYLFHPYAAARAAGVVPDARIVLLLRNPVDRALSHYRLAVQLGFETLPLVEAFERETSRLAEDLAAMHMNPLHDGVDLLNFSYVARGIYADQLAAWMDHYSDEQILILKSEELFEEPAIVYRQVSDFLGLPTWEPSKFRVFGTRTQRSWTSSLSEGLDKSARGELVQLFRPHNQRLYDLVGRDFGW
jgi:hypothetical protein